MTDRGVRAEIAALLGAAGWPGLRAAARDGTSIPSLARSLRGHTLGRSLTDAEQAALAAMDAATATGIEARDVARVMAGETNSIGETA